MPHKMFRQLFYPILCLILTGQIFLHPQSSAQETTINLPDSPTHPYIACTTDELARLREAYQGNGPEHKVIASYIKTADKHVGSTIDFPPRGAQHNQWYQCEDCQFGLKTIDATHHQCPKCEKIYTGYPYDDVVFMKTHNNNFASALSTAWGYAITQDEKYAKHTANVLRGYAKRYRDYPYHCNKACKDDSNHSKSGGHIYEQTLNEASVFSSQIGPAYDLIYNSTHLSQDDHALIKEGLLLPMLTNLDRNKAGRSNWQSWHNAAMLWGGALLNDPTWVQKAIYAEGNGFLEQMKISVMSEGMWYENSWAYHFYSLRSLTILAEAARRIGIDVWSDKTFKKMFMVPLRYRMPNNSLPRFGDDVNSYVPIGDARMEQAYHAYRNPSLLPLLSTKPTFENILLGRKVQEKIPFRIRDSDWLYGAGHAILRTKGNAELSAAMTFGPYGGSHGHYDKLSFVFFGHGQELAVDPGRAKNQAYRLPIHKNWYKATISHNTVLVDGQSQQPAKGQIKFFQNSNTHATVGAISEEAYPGVKHTRTLSLYEDFLLVVDQLQSDKEHRFDWVYHNRGTQAFNDVVTKTTTIPSYPGFEYIENIKTGKSDQLITVRFPDKKVITHLTLAAQENTTILTGDGVGASVLERIPLTMVTRHGKTATFVATLEPVRKWQNPTILNLSHTMEDGQIKVTIQRKNDTKTLYVHPDGIAHSQKMRINPSKE